MIAPWRAANSVSRGGRKSLGIAPTLGFATRCLKSVIRSQRSASFRTVINVQPAKPKPTGTEIGRHVQP
jgi:hypothetical protein